MNYRQWKKKYKKTHGYNPPLEEDKRKQAKVARKVLVEFPTAYNSITEMLNDFAPRLFNALASACDTLSRGFGNASNTYRQIAENYNQVTEREVRG